MGICDTFRFNINHVAYTVKVYVVHTASFQLLLGNEFLWMTGAALFPRWGAFALLLPVAQFLTATCELIPEADTNTQGVDAQSGERIVPLPASGVLKSPFAYFDTTKLEHLAVTIRKRSQYLKIGMSKDAISIGEKDLIKEVDPDSVTPGYLSENPQSIFQIDYLIICVLDLILFDSYPSP